MRTSLVFSIFAFSACLLLLLSANEPAYPYVFEPDSQEQQIVLQEQLIQLRERKLELVSILGEGHPKIGTLTERIQSLEKHLADIHAEFPTRLKALNGIEDVATRLLVEKLLVRVDRLEHKIKKQESHSNEN